jgi:hypothetical protein
MKRGVHGYVSRRYPLLLTKAGLKALHEGHEQRLRLERDPVVLDVVAYVLKL